MVSKILINLWENLFKKFKINRTKLIEILDEGNKVAGYYTVIWNAHNIPSGTYFIRFSSSKYNATRKVSLVK